MSAPRGTTVSVRHVDEEKRPKKWGVFWNEYLPGHVGRPKARSKYYATEAEAETVAVLVRADLAQAHPAPLTASGRTNRTADAFATFAIDVWLPFAEKHTSGNTYKSYYNTIVNWIAPEEGHKRYPALGNALLTDEVFTTQCVFTYLEGLYTARVRRTMRARIRGVLNTCCKFAIQSGRLKVNPCRELGITLRDPNAVEPEPEANPYTPDEIKRIFDQLYASEDLCWQVFCLWQYHVGTRPGEASALKWTTVFLDRSKARIEFSYSEVEKRDKPPKTYERRDVDLTDELVTLLYRWRAVQAAECLRRGYPPPEYVFTTLSANRRAPRQLTRILPGGTIRMVITRTLKACGITGHTLYDFRHSFATSHLVQGWFRKITWVSKQLGHKTPETTKKHYYAYRDTTDSAGFANEIGGFK
jgi:integrase